MGGMGGGGDGGRVRECVTVGFWVGSGIASSICMYGCMDGCMNVELLALASRNLSPGGWELGFFP